jgi:hypothetical protein
MRCLDLETSGEIWLYRPGSDQGEHGDHKTAWHGIERIVPSARAPKKCYGHGCGPTSRNTCSSRASRERRSTRNAGESAGLP